MKAIKTLAMLSVLGLLISGCASTRPATQARRQFNEARSANVVLQFSSWEYTFLLQPRYDANGFLLQVPRDKVGQVFQRLNVQKRELAVVVIGWSYTPAQMKQLVADWKTILGGCGFQRLVVIKSNGSKQINGSWIIDDSNLSGGGTPGVTQL